ncbi:MAG: hypothetical protein QG622_2051 [Actinomycetota bacterium]|nr:hypothetical protein [Actinomycetota bacterium]
MADPVPWDDRGAMISTHLPFRLGGDLSADDAREAQRLLGEHLLVPLLLDVVIAADAVLDRSLRAAAVGLLVTTRLSAAGAVIAQDAAAWVWAAGASPRYVDVVIQPGRIRSPSPYVVVHERRMTQGDVVEIRAGDAPPLAVTTPARTAADLLRSLPEPLALEAATRLASRTGTDPAAIAACLAAMPGARGVARARVLLARWPGETDGELGPSGPGPSPCAFR